MATRKSDILAPEDIIVDIKYTFSINPDDDHQYWLDDDRINKSRDIMQSYINSIDADIVLQMEVSRLGRLHYHGTIEFDHHKQVLKFFCISLRNLLNKTTIEIDNIVDLSEWHEYCQKGSHFELPHIITNKAQLERYKQLVKRIYLKQHPIDIEHKHYF